MIVHVEKLRSPAEVSKFAATMSQDDVLGFEVTVDYGVGVEELKPMQNIFEVLPGSALADWGVH